MAIKWPIVVDESPERAVLQLKAFWADNTDTARAPMSESSKEHFESKRPCVF